MVQRFTTAGGLAATGLAVAYVAVGNGGSNVSPAVAALGGSKAWSLREDATKMRTIKTEHNIASAVEAWPNQPPTTTPRAEPERSKSVTNCTVRAAVAIKAIPATALASTT